MDSWNGNERRNGGNGWSGLNQQTGVDKEDRRLLSGIVV